jgi:hypothetical protein
MLLRVKFISYRKPPTGPGARKSCDMSQVALVGGLNGSICVLKIRLIIRSCSMTLYLAENPLILYWEIQQENCNLLIFTCSN